MIFLSRAIYGLLVVMPYTPVASAADALRDFTGAHTRVVWVQDQSPANNDILAAGQRLKLMGFDSEDNRERAILAELRNYCKPLLTPDGKRVVFSDQQAQKFFVVNWDGSGKKLLGEGLAVDVWRDPQDGTDWVYFGRRVGKVNDVTYRQLRRLKLDSPKTTQAVWNQTDVGCDNFQLSADGTKAAGEFPWPNGGVVDLAQKKWKKLEQGCWASMAPDNSGVSWVFDGPHRHLQFHRPDQEAGWKVPVNSAPLMQGAEVFHPRWSNHARYLVVTGPYSVKGKVNMISGGGPQVEVYLGRFDPGYQTVEAWHQVTDNSHGDFYPDAWIEGGETTRVELPGLKNDTPTVEVATWPVVRSGLLFAWSNSAETNQLAATDGRDGRACQIELHGRTFPGRFHDIRLQGGTATLQDISEPLITTCRNSRELTIEIVVTPSASDAKRTTFLEIGGPGEQHVTLTQEAGRLQWTVETSQGQVERPIWASVAPAHLMAVLSGKQLKVYVDSQLVSSTRCEVNFANWKTADITLGSKTWQGDMEAIALFGRALSADEISQQATSIRQRLARRAPIARIQVQATCRERSVVPDPQQLLPYRRALAVHDYEIKKVIAGSPTKDVKPGLHVLVAQWVIFDSKILPESSKPKVGETIELTLEPLEGHPELQSERQVLDVEALDLPTYYDAK